MHALLGGVGGLPLQLMQLCPPIPHAVTAVPPRQAPALQQPTQPLAVSQMHCPEERHWVPVPHPTHAAPPTPQWAAVLVKH